MERTEILMFKDEIVAFVKSLETTNLGTFIRLDKSTLIIDSTHNKPNIHINEDIWKTRRPIVESRLKAIAGQSKKIPARLCKVRRIDQPTLDKFLIDNHLQGTTKAKFKYGLYLPQQYFRILNFVPDSNTTEILFAVASFSGTKSIQREEQIFRSCELIRFTNLLGFTVVGGLDKLLQAFIREQKPDDIMTYADKDWSNGKSYLKLGFELIGTTEPEHFWINKITFERKYASKFTPENDDWYLIANSGNLKFLKKLKI